MTLFVQNAPLIALLFFFLVFAGIALWAYWPRNRAHLQKHADIPFRE